MAFHCLIEISLLKFKKIYERKRAKKVLSLYIFCYDIQPLQFKNHDLANSIQVSLEEYMKLY